MVDEVLGHFGQRRSAAQEKYREYVSDGIGKGTIWENLQAQSHVAGKQKLREVPKAQRLMGRVSLKKSFEESDGKASAIDGSRKQYTDMSTVRSKLRVI